jgi:hypothetical protein
MQVRIGPFRNNTRIERVAIRPYDTWDLFTTLAIIIHPSLVQFREQAQSCPATRVPDEELEILEMDEFGNDPFQDDDGNWWSYDLGRWLVILDKMIFSFEKVQTDWNEEFFDDVGDVFDQEGYTRLTDEIQEGLDLFAKYYTALWI